MKLSGFTAVTASVLFLTAGSAWAQCSGTTVASQEKKDGSCEKTCTGTADASGAAMTLASWEPPAASAKAGDIIDVAVGAGKFNTLAAALKAAGLVETLKGAGPFTVFAPTDEAFAKLPKGTVESLLKPENKEKLIGILKYHVVQGRVYSPDAVKAGKAATLQGGSVTIASAGGVTIDNAKVESADLDASNGVIHVIDTVIMPK